MEELNFIEIPLGSPSPKLRGVFAAKNDKNVVTTLTGKRYRPLAQRIVREHDDKLNLPIGNFIQGLKDAGDPLYIKFLNAYGDLEYMRFEPDFGVYRDKRGIYRYLIAGEVKYIGSATKTFHNRIHSGYGDIDPTNCFKEGQSTNCLLNALIALNWGQVRLEICPLDLEKGALESLELQLIRQYDPEWNCKHTTHKRRGIMRHFAHLGY